MLSPTHGHRPPSNSSSPSRGIARSPTRVLADVSEREECEFKISNTGLVVDPTLSTPKRRSRSPMKKMFGENGWLGRSPDELDAVKLKSKKSSSARKEKSSVMEKLRNKFEELAEKADLSPTSRGARSHEKHPKLTVLAVSLGPPEQARIYMEMELMLVHTANAFLMTQFSHGRMAMDSIKKTVDSWKARGRPTVLEFMYDQATQRDLIAANQHNLRFYGEKSGDEVRIHATLYNWRQVASFMALRTFCDADTVILKLLFDIEQILHLLGAREPLLLRLQQIRASANDTMRAARVNNQSSTGREPTWISQSSNNNSSRTQSIDDPYGGLKLVPESYRG
ncbi:hypothetical protein N431DRAFT_324272 [Stipitochalara longipes BDJ]|nr:hypothetical protein N431DRAFT_324272 [Stipitochalara longipes BDJ]